MRMSLEIFKTPTAWRWRLIDQDTAIVSEESADIPYVIYTTGSWKPAEAAARAAHPEIPDSQVRIHAVRDYGTFYEDSLDRR